MSARDERRAAIYLERRRHYGLDGQPKPRARSRTGLALGVFILIAWCGFLLLSCDASPIFQVRMSGGFEQWTGKAYYDAIHGAPLRVPTYFRLRFNIPVFTKDEDPDPQLGVYTSQDTTVECDFGTFREVAFGVRVSVYSGKNGLWGFLLENLNPGVSYGVPYPARFGFYAFSLQPFSSSVAPTDELHWVYSSQGSRWHTTNKHAYKNAAGIHTEADNWLSTYVCDIE